MTNEENKKALEAAMFLSEFCYTQDECKDCIFRRDYDCCCILKDECMSWQEDNYLIDLLDQLNVEAVKQEIYKEFMARLLEEYNKYQDDVILYGKDYATEKLNKGAWQDKVLKDLFNGGEEC